MKATNEITGSEDVLDSRDIIARIAYLENDREAGILTDEEAVELAELKEAAEEAEGYVSDWPHGEALVRDSYFARYAEELAEDLGAIDPNAGWPLYCIDWEQAARDLRMDYTEIAVRGSTYYARV
jgi:antirestriction protein